MIHIYFIIGFIVLFASFNAYTILWEQDIKNKRKLYSKIWHALGRMLIGLVGIYTLYILDFKLWSLETLYWFFWGAMMSWIVWDLIINAIRMFHGTKIDLFYIDKNSMNKFIFWILGKSKLFFTIIKIILLILSVYLLMKLKL